MLKKILTAPLVQILLLTALVLAGMAWPAALFEHIENMHFDFWSARFRAPDDASVAILAIDQESIDRFGDWPWPRSRVAEMVRLLTEAGAGAQGIDLLYGRPDADPGLAEIQAIRDQVTAPQWKGKEQNTRKLLDLLAGAETRLNQDAQLADAIRRARNTVLPIRFTPGISAGDDDTKLSGLLIINSNKVPSIEPEPRMRLLIDGRHLGAGAGTVPAGGIQTTFEELASKAGGLGHINIQTDRDGVVRRLPLLKEYRGRLFPSMALQLAIKKIHGRFRNLTIETDWSGRKRLRIKHLDISTDGAYRMLLDHNPQWTGDRTYPFCRVVDGTVDAKVFRDRIVLVGVTASGVAPAYRVGTHNDVSPVAILADAVARLLSKDRLSRPAWALPLEVLALLYFSFFLIFFIPRVNIRLGGALLSIFLLTWYGAGVGALLAYGYRIKLFAPVLFACTGFALVQATRMSRQRQIDKMESNKTLGLSYQGQGMLDMACEKYMQCPVGDGSVKNLLYNLGLDFERKRMFNKAVAVYEHIRTGGNFKDIGDRITRLKAMDDPLAMSGGRPGDPTMKMDDTTTKPTFGRYEILRELGSGAMGTVYLGRDPKINRQVAIKTLAYDEVETGELDEVKERFFREAEAAGKLSHPNIVSIYDAGEEHDMAYIAMELLKGENLTRYCHPSRLLSVWQVLSHIAEVTAALDYAHCKGVVHRDIKPGNIMLLEDGRIKVTDFGIARVIDASRTRTGVILGTPSYMSPEQVAGKNVDGRSDLFSLGVVFYQLLTGTKPFKGDNITAILYAITHNAYAPLSDILPDLPPCIGEVVDKLLAKGVTKRFQSAAQLTKALKKCMKAQ
jgi:CHASE2 domain-containing sensor protein/tRNA A-37 threonylcarbamoyl transferase component Bud32